MIARLVLGVVAAGGLVIGCEPQLVIEGAVAIPPPDCVADVNGPRMVRTSVDIDEAEYGATTALVVDAAPPDSFAGFTSAFVWFTGAPSGLPSSRENPRVNGLQSIVFVERPPPDGVDELAFVQLITADEIAFLLDAPEGTLEANIVVEGRRADDVGLTIESDPFTIAIDLCHGCLRAECVEEAGCIRGQDDLVGPLCASL